MRNADERYADCNSQLDPQNQAGMFAQNSVLWNANLNCSVDGNNLSALELTASDQRWNVMVTYLHSKNVLA